MLSSINFFLASFRICFKEIGHSHTVGKERANTPSHTKKKDTAELGRRGLIQSSRLSHQRMQNAREGEGQSDLKDVIVQLRVCSSSQASLLAPGHSCALGLGGFNAGPFS